MVDVTAMSVFHICHVPPCMSIRRAHFQMSMPTHILIWWALLRRKGVQEEVLGQLIFLNQFDPTKAGTLAWIAATKPGVHNPNSWLGRATREKLMELGLYPVGL